MSVQGSSAGSACGVGRLEGLETDEPALERGFGLEQDEQGVVAGERADLVGEARLVDGLGDRARPIPGVASRTRLRPLRPIRTGMSSSRRRSRSS